jgi:hypothetical protein
MPADSHPKTAPLDEITIKPFLLSTKIMGCECLPSRRLVRPTGGEYGIEKTAAAD